MIGLHARRYRITAPAPRSMGPLGLWRAFVFGTCAAACALAALAAFAAFAALGGAAAATGAPAAVIHIKNFTFGPSTVTVAPGQQITWVNDDPVPHTATDAQKGWDTGQLAPGASMSVTFTRAGTYAYMCAVHPFMQASVIVR